MQVRAVFSGVLAVGLTFALMLLGCGGTQEEYRAVSRPAETSATYPLAPQRDEIEVSAAIRRQLKLRVLAAWERSMTFWTNQLVWPNMAHRRETT